MPNFQNMLFRGATSQLLIAISCCLLPQYLELTIWNFATCSVLPHESCLRLLLTWDLLVFTSFVPPTAYNFYRPLVAHFFVLPTSCILIASLCLPTRQPLLACTGFHSFILSTSYLLLCFLLPTFSSPWLAIISLLLHAAIYCPLEALITHVVQIRINCKWLSLKTQDRRCSTTYFLLGKVLGMLSKSLPVPH